MMILFWSKRNDAIQMYKKRLGIVQNLYMKKQDFHHKIKIILL